MGKVINQVETGFYIRIGEWEKVYAIEDSTGSLCAIVWRKYNTKQTYKFQIYLSVEWDLQYISGRKFSEQEIRMISCYYHNLVRTLTDDMQTIYTDHIEERMNLPFMTNLLHIKVL